ncbi:MAG: iron-sulfur cluster assembly accessory protein [Actinomycetota bacterium]
MSNDTATVVSVTEGAATKIKQLATKEGRDEAILRLRVLAGGCSGFTYKLGFEDAPADGDSLIRVGDATVLIDQASVPIVQGSTLEFNDAMLGGGLRVVNPQAVSECACGDSFSI